VSAETFVKRDSFDTELYRKARRAEEDRLKGDYEAVSLSTELAAEHVATATRFIGAVVAMVKAE
jgi:uncharacterized protein (UPF0332 family)